MVKNVFFQTSLLSSLLLLSCQTNLTLTIDRNFELANKNQLSDIDDLLISVNTDDIHRLINAGESMVLYLGNEFCSSCQALKPNLKEYLLEYQPVMYHYNHLINDNILTYDTLVTAFPQIFSPQIQTPSFYFIERNQRLFHYQGPTSEFTTYRSFEAIMNFRLTINNHIFYRFNNPQGWILIKAFEDNPITIENIDWLYTYFAKDTHFTNDNQSLSWFTHDNWEETQQYDLDPTVSYLINVNNEPYDIYNLTQLTLSELNLLIQN